MKRFTTLLAILVMVISVSSFTQDKTEKTKDPIKPALVGIGAQNNDYKAFMVKNAIISPSSEYTKNVEQIFDAISYDFVQLLIENAGK